jgi:4-hydroxy-tetrahydrodipicolinate synthase
MIPSLRTSSPLYGIIPPMPTPLRDRETLDIPGLERLIEYLVTGGVHGIFILGSTGEAPGLGRALQRELVTRTCAMVRARVPVLVGVTDTRFAESVDLARHAADAGAAAVVFAPPFYFPMAQDELLGYTRRLVAELPLPAVLYNMPRMTKVTFEPQTVEQLLDVERIIGMKDSGGDLPYFQRIVEIARAARPNWPVLVGPERLLVDIVRLGGSGGVNGGANVCPRLLVDLFDAATRNDEPRIAALKERLSKLGQIYFAGTRASMLFRGMKCALSLLGICNDAVAEPFSPCDAADRERIRGILSELSLL